jgi:hypothetical protein
VLFPVLRRVDEVLAIGYLIVRGAVETACYVVLAIGWLMLAHWARSCRQDRARRHRRACVWAAS